MHLAAYTLDDAVAELRELRTSAQHGSPPFRVSHDRATSFGRRYSGILWDGGVAYQGRSIPASAPRAPQRPGASLHSTILRDDSTWAYGPSSAWQPSAAGLEDDESESDPVRLPTLAQPAQHTQRPESEALGSHTSRGRSIGTFSSGTVASDNHSVFSHQPSSRRRRPSRPSQGRNAGRRRFGT
jgi:hypothetical protein